jgi:hypothetical protein
MKKKRKQLNCWQKQKPKVVVVAEVVALVVQVVVDKDAGLHPEAVAAEALVVEEDKPPVPLKGELRWQTLQKMFSSSKYCKLS